MRELLSPIMPAKRHSRDAGAALADAGAMEAIADVIYCAAVVSADIALRYFRCQRYGDARGACRAQHEAFSPGDAIFGRITAQRYFEQAHVTKPLARSAA